MRAGENGRESVALVTGAGGGIGTEICRELATRGFRIVACDRDGSALERLARALDDQGPPAAYRAFDVTDQAMCESAIAWVQAEVGGLDVLVNNAGAWFYEAFVDSTDEHWRDVFDVNLFAPVRLTRAAAPMLRRAGHPRVVNIATINVYLSQLGWSSYDASKSALLTLTRSLALELAEFGILVNAVAPGFIATEANQSVLDDPEMSEILRRRIPLGRFGAPAEVAQAVAFFCSEECSFATGAVLQLDGGHLAGERLVRFE